MDIHGPLVILDDHPASGDEKSTQALKRDASYQRTQIRKIPYEIYLPAHPQDRLQCVAPHNHFTTSEYTEERLLLSENKKDMRGCCHFG